MNILDTLEDIEKDVLYCKKSHYNCVIPCSEALALIAIARAAIRAERELILPNLVKFNLQKALAKLEPPGE